MAGTVVDQLIWCKSYDTFRKNYELKIKKLRTYTTPYGAIFWLDREAGAFMFTIFTDKDEFETVLYMNQKSQEFAPDDRFKMTYKVYNNK